MTKGEKAELSVVYSMIASELQEAIAALARANWIADNSDLSREMSFCPTVDLELSLSDMATMLHYICGKSVKAGAMMKANALANGDDKEEDGCVLPLDRPEPAA